MPEDRYLGPGDRQKEIALRLYEGIKALPIVAPHGNVDPRLFSDPDYRFRSPAELFVIPDHYILRMLFSQGIPLESLGVGENGCDEHRQIWQTFADHFYFFRGTPSGIWFREAFATVFGIGEKLTPKNAQPIYDEIADKLQEPDFTPRRLYERFNIELLCTTDAATDTLAHHRVILESGWNGRILPTFHPDAVVNLDSANWHEQLAALSVVSGIYVVDYPSYIAAIEQRRAFFKSMGATATDHAALTPYTSELSGAEAGDIFQRALAGEATPDDAHRFTGHMLMEMARMSIEDGLVMQLHVGAYRNHNLALYGRFGSYMGADIPVRTEFTRNLAPLLQKYGSDPRLTLILFTLDEAAYARELAPMAGHYPAEAGSALVVP